jgi:hypothetical protein
MSNYSISISLQHFLYFKDLNLVSLTAFDTEKVATFEPKNQIYHTI